MKPPPGADIVGRRISVRSLLPSGAATDVVGRLMSVEPVLRIERRDGRITTVDPQSILIWRIVPDRPVRAHRASATPADTLGRIMTRAWPPLELLPLGTWDLRAAGGFTKRANSAGAYRDPEAPLDDVLSQVHDFYTERCLPPLIQVQADSDLERRLTERQWRVLPGGDALVQVAQLDRRWPIDAAIGIAARPDDAWLDSYGRVEGLREQALGVLTAVPTVAHLSLDGAIARVAVTGEWAGLSALWVPPQQRRRSLARRLVTASLGWAVEQGADKAHLQVEVGNEAADRLYREFGFVDHHGYRYLAHPSV